MPGNLHIALVANYRPDGQYSMLRFADMLEAGLRDRGLTVTRLEPAIVCGGTGPLAKWRGYVDKYLLFPGRLKRDLRQLSAASERLVVHVLDHSNASYLTAATGLPRLINCHDLMAIKSALGLVPQNPTRWSGRVLQRWIFKHLKRAPHIAAISVKTMADLKTLAGMGEERVTHVSLALPYPFEPMDTERANAFNSPLQPPYFLHVGSDAWYKNRPGVLAIFRQLRRTYPEAKLAFVGPPSAELEREIEVQLLGSSVVFIRDITDEKLQALYSRAECLLFPSFDEGFGLPIAEAQACGCPVAITDREPMTEVGGDAAIKLPRAPAKTDERNHWAATCAELIKAGLQQRDSLVADGLENAKRFDLSVMVERAIDLYEQLAEVAP